MSLAETNTLLQLVLPRDPTILEHVIACYAQNMGMHIILEAIGDGIQFTQDSAYALLDRQFAVINADLSLDRKPNFDQEDFEVIWETLVPITKDGLTIPYAEINKAKYKSYNHGVFTSAKLLYRLISVGTCDYRPDSRIQIYDRIWNLLSERIIKGLSLYDEDEE
jgi:hypothetical protein